jgi:hypothetical protein
MSCPSSADRLGLLKLIEQARLPSTSGQSLLSLKPALGCSVPIAFSQIITALEERLVSKLGILNKRFGFWLIGTGWGKHRRSYYLHTRVKGIDR